MKSKSQIVSQIHEWVLIMTDIYGSLIKDIDGKEYTWTTALYREQYGKEWSTLDKKNIQPNEKTLKIAHKWSCGKLPKWIVLVSGNIEEDIDGNIKN